MRIWYVLAAVVIVSILAAGQAQVAWSQETRPAEGTPTPGAVEGAPTSGAVEKDKPAKQDEPTTKPQEPPASPFGGMGRWILPVMIGVMVLLWFWMGRGRRKQQQQRKVMLEALKKGDKVTSIGGIIGTVVEIKGGEVTVKVDESANVRMKFARWAIRGVGETGKAENPGEESK